MSTAKSSSKKRKRSVSPESLLFRLSTSIPAQVGPLLVTYPALKAPSSTVFKCYARKKMKTKSQENDTEDPKSQELLAVGETDSVEFVTNDSESRKVAGLGCHYLVAAHNRRTGSLSILPMPKSPHVLTRTVKALKSIPPAAAPSKTQFHEARAALGETFGTKKAKAAIKAQERNVVDVGAMEGVMGYVMDSIDKGAGGLMSTEEAKDAADQNRLIPPFNATTMDPSDVYPLHDIVSEAEWKALSVTAFDDANDDKERIALLPFRYSKWLTSHLSNISQEAGKSKKKRMKILLYISAMLGFRQALLRKDFDKDYLYEKFSGVPSIVLDSLVSRFTEVSRGSTKHQATSATKTLILTNIFALCLKLDKFASDTDLLAHDLSMKVSEVNQLFKSLGCKIVTLGERERTRLGIPDSSASTKRAVLNAPVVFPKPRLRRKT
ncbi:hypothetical protein K443DRAFT_390225 [Laccaria amethystina LaAM-08-1]|uniref:DNA-directed RNA polymerase I subunit RPA49 n=1 Tax=Laccaria amethystina LaAM-08-1 TaxID=1095629 RepID=A0A0C9XBD8_9AGAR|nr:hypothetical protein K443DRAFT_390225 [Laccaria amethystina LaAM-08-1]